MANQFSEESYFQNKSSLQHFLTDRKLNWATWYISPDRVTGLLLKIIAGLLVFSFVEKTAFHWLASSTKLQLSPHYFDFDSEGNFPSLYSALTLGLCSLLLALISKIKRTIQSRDLKERKSWMALAYIFLYLAFDEFCSIHELIIQLIASVFPTNPGLIVGSIVVIAFLIVFRNLIYNLPSKIRTLFFIAGGLYILGVSGIEDDIAVNTQASWLISTIKELLEMLGIVIFIHGLLVYIKSYLVELNGSLFFEKVNK